MLTFLRLSLSVLCLASLALAETTPTKHDDVKDVWEKVVLFNDRAMVGPPRTKSNDVVTLKEAFKNGQDAFFNSSEAKFKSTACFKFDFHMNVPADHGLRLVHYNTTTKVEKVVWSRLGFTADIWETAGVVVFLQKGDQLNFVANTVGGSISLSNIKFDFTNDACRTSWLSTSFEEEDIWWDAKIKLAKDATKFGFDHTSLSPYGKVAFVEAGKIVPTKPMSSLSQCFEFWFYRPFVSGAKPVQFVLNVNGKQEFKVQDDTHITDQWTRVQVPVDFPREQPQSLEFVLDPATTPQQGGVLFDDFDFLQRPCDAPVSCAFNQTVCSWKHQFMFRSGYAGSQWKLGTGRVDNLFAYNGRSVPLVAENHLYVDFSNQSLSAVKLPSKAAMVNGVVNKGRFLELWSEVLPTNVDYCLTVNMLYSHIKPEDEFFIQTSSFIRSLPKIENLFQLNSLDASQLQNLDVYTRKQLQLNIHATDYARRLVFSARSPNQLARIGIEGVQLQPGKCVEVVTSKLDKQTLVVADELMKSTRNNVARILELIKIDDPVKEVSSKLLNEINAAIELIEKSMK